LNARVVGPVEVKPYSAPQCSGTGLSLKGDIMKRRIIIYILSIVLMVAFVCGAANANFAKRSHKTTEREYWIAADEVMWDYMPSYPINLMTGEELMG